MLGTKVVLNENDFSMDVIQNLTYRPISFYAMKTGKGKTWLLHICTKKHLYHGPWGHRDFFAGFNLYVFLEYL